MEQKDFDMRLDYEELAEYIYDCLIDLGYAPASDEVLDIADFMMDFILMLLSSGGVELFVEMEESEGDVD